MSDEATVIELPKDRVIFVPVVYTSWFSSGSWPYSAITKPYFGQSGLPKDTVKEDLNCLSGSGLKIGVGLETVKGDVTRDVITLNVSKCKASQSEYLLALAFESIRLTATDKKS